MTTYIRTLCILSLFLMAPAIGWGQADPTTPPLLPGNQVATVSGSLSSSLNKDYSSVGEALEALTSTANGTVKLNISTTLEGKEYTLNQGVKINLNGLSLTCASGTKLTAGAGKTIEIVNNTASSISRLDGSFSFSGKLLIDGAVEMKDTRVYRDGELRYRTLVTVPNASGTLGDLRYGSELITDYIQKGTTQLCCWLPESATPQIIMFSFTNSGTPTYYQTNPVIISRHLQSPLPSRLKDPDAAPVVRVTPTGLNGTDYVELGKGLQQLATSGGTALLLQNVMLASECTFAGTVDFDLASYNLTGNAQSGLLTSNSGFLHMKRGTMSGNFHITPNVLVDKSVALTANMLIDSKQMYRVRVILPDASYTHYLYNATTYKAFATTHILDEDGNKVAYLWLPAQAVAQPFKVAKSAAGADAKTLNSVVIESNHDNVINAKLGDIQAIVYELGGSPVDDYEFFHDALEAIKTPTGRKLVLQSDVTLTGTPSGHDHALNSGTIATIDLNRRNLYGDNCTLKATETNSCYLITDPTRAGSITGNLLISGNIYMGDEIAASKIATVTSGSTQVYRLLVKISETVTDGFYDYTYTGGSGQCYVKDNTACFWFPLNKELKDLAITVSSNIYTAQSVTIRASHSNTSVARLPGVVAKIGDVNYTTLKEAFAAVNADDQEIEICADATLSEAVNLSYTVKVKNEYEIDMNGKKITMSGDKTFYMYSLSGKGSATGNFEIDGKVYFSSTVKLDGTVKLGSDQVYRSILLLTAGTTAATYDFETTMGGYLFFSGESDALNKVITYAWIKNETGDLTAKITAPTSIELPLTGITVFGLHTNRFDMTAGTNVAQVGTLNYRTFALALAAANTSGEKITLLQSLVLRENQSVIKDITIDLASFILTATADAAFIVTDGKTLIIEDSTAPGAKGSLYGTLRISGTVFVDPAVALAGTVVRNGTEVYRTMVEVPGSPANAIIEYTDASKITPADKAYLKDSKACLWLPPTTLEHDLSMTISNAPYEVTLVPALPSHQATEKAHKVVTVDANNNSWASADNQDCNVVVSKDVTLTIPSGSALTSLHRIIMEDGSQVICEKTGDVLVTGGIIYRRTFTQANAWESFSLPFNARRITAIQGKELIEMQPYQDNATGGHFWLKALATDGSFQYVTEEKIRANEGYIIAVPANLATGNATGENIIDFASPANQYLQRTLVKAVPPATTGFRQLANGTYQAQTLTGITYYYRISDDGTRYDRVVAASTPLPPFRSYLLADNITAAKTASFRIGQLPTANDAIAPALPGLRLLTLTVQRGQLRIEAQQECLVEVVAMNGRRVFRQRIPSGVTRLLLSVGIYVVNGQKIVVP